MNDTQVTAWLMIAVLVLFWVVLPYFSRND